MDDIKTRLFRSVYTPEYKEDSSKIYRQFSSRLKTADAEREVEVDKERKRKQTKKALSEDRPLTDEEMVVVHERYAQLKEHADKVRSKVKLIRDEIEFELSEDPFELVMGGKKPALKKAMKIVFGINTDTITFEQYKAALDMKTILEKADIEAVFTGAE